MNLAPISDAGQDQTVEIGADVTLSGTQSRDPEGSPLSFSWTQTSGGQVALQGTNTPTVTFSPGEPGSYTFELTVSDGVNSGKDTIGVTATAISGQYLKAQRIPSP